jgi:MraZ protein
VEFDAGMLYPKNDTQIELQRIRMPPLVGCHINKIDRKGRVSVPKPFRDSLGALGPGFPGVYVYPSFTAAAIEGCSEEFMNRVSESISELNLFSEEQDDLASVLLGSAHALPFDPEGRVVLPDALIQHANLGTQAAFVGRGQSFQIWNPETYKEHSARAFERARARNMTLELKRRPEA